MPTESRLSQDVVETATTTSNARSAFSQVAVEAMSKTTADTEFSHVLVETIAKTSSDTVISQVLVEAMYKITPWVPPELYGNGGIVFGGPGNQTSTAMPTDCIVQAVTIVVTEPCPGPDCVTVCLTPEQEFYG